MARSFDGTTGDTITIPDSTPLRGPSTAITVGLWVYVTNSPGSYPILIDKRYNGGVDTPYVSYNLQQYSSSARVLQFNVGESGGVIKESGTTGPTALNTNTWYFAAGRWSSGNTVELRVFNADGSLYTSDANNSWSGTIGYTADLVRIGGKSDSGATFAGRKAWVLVDDISYTDEQIKHFMFTGRPVGACNLLMPLQTSTEVDLSGNDGVITVTGTTLVDSPPTMGPMFGYDNVIPLPVAAAAGGRIMNSLTNHGGLAGKGGIAGAGGGLAG